MDRWEGDLSYEVWRRGGNPDAVDFDDYRDDRAAGRYPDEVAADEVARQRSPYPSGLNRAGWGGLLLLALALALPAGAQTLNSLPPGEVARLETLRRMGEAAQVVESPAMAFRECLPGVGFPGVPPGFARRSVPENQWRGFYAELRWVNTVALTNAWKANTWGTLDSHCGVPTVSEEDYLLVNTDKRSPFYRTWWHEQSVGGLATNPHVLDDSLSLNVLQGFRKLVEAGGRWQLGGPFSATGFWSWPVWYLNNTPPEHPVNAGIMGGGTGGGTGGGISCASPRIYTSTPREALRCQYFPLSGRCRLWKGWTPEFPRCCPGVECPAEPSFCGDSRCDTGEDCLICTQDCGACPEPPDPCGDGTCDEVEFVTGQCPADCPVDPPPPSTCSPPAEVTSLLGDLEDAAAKLKLALDRALAAYREWATTTGTAGTDSTGRLDTVLVEDGP